MVVCLLRAAGNRTRYVLPFSPLKGSGGECQLMNVEHFAIVVQNECLVRY